MCRVSSVFNCSNPRTTWSDIRAIPSGVHIRAYRCCLGPLIVVVVLILLAGYRLVLDAVAFASICRFSIRLLLIVLLLLLCSCKQMPRQPSSLHRVAMQSQCEFWREWCLFLPDLLIESEALTADIFRRSQKAYLGRTNDQGISVPLNV
jgi:hypothetical protein